jgi:hypothetical protein
MVKLWERPAVRLFSVFLLLGGFAWWIFQTVSLPPTLRDLWNEDQAIAEAATALTEEQQYQAELAKLPAPPENHAPEVSKLMERLRSLPPAPSIVQAARQRDQAIPQGEQPPPWSEEELAALSHLSVLFRQAWMPFLSERTISWEKYPDSVRLFRSNLIKILTAPSGYEIYGEFLTDPEMNLYGALRGLGALRFGSDFLLESGWAALDTTGLANYLGRFVIDSLNFSEFISPNNLPPPPRIEDLRMGLRSDQSLFSSAAAYLETLPPQTPALPALERFLGNKKNAKWFMEKIPEAKTAEELAKHLREDVFQISLLENRTFLNGPAWRQWLAGDPAAGLSPTLRECLNGLREFEAARLQYQVALAFLEARQKLQTGGIKSAARLPDPARPGSFLQIKEQEGTVTVTSAFRFLEDPAEVVSLEFSLEPTPKNQP